MDDKEAVQSFTHDWQCWAAGSTKGNNEAIHIEMCMNVDGDNQ
ncbi:MULTISPECIES: N-acetylmuramoyl-L-alanine amidase [Lysinibacillus]|nr:N-acetylmuramoyl-L-alanine amidase [Lysinibacillus fusiformis]MCE4044096.1 N-acetylmuramoyl-L-alanine amidase [Lysinibacillus fusiformis]MCT6927279.1 N-acetylmuramoyl-L-alanine amidase [Lysinibacillus fusiformis]MCT6931613.1 N-acetylmuramoyl-L-alanine amidase [Lysinibacillus fusiformis]